MEKPEDHAGSDVSNNYCVHCARPDGSMQSYEEKLHSMSRFIARTEGLGEQAARSKAEELMAELPAWQGRPEN